MAFFASIEYCFFILAFLISMFIAIREGFRVASIVLVFSTLFILLFHSRHSFPIFQSGWLQQHDHSLIKVEMLFEVALYLVLYISLLQRKAFRLFLSFYLILFLIFSFIVLSIMQPIYTLKYPIYSFVFGSFGVLIGILLFFYEKLKADNAGSIFTNFWFWISAGLFVFLATEVPVLSITNYLLGKDAEVIRRAEVVFDVKRIISLCYYFTFQIGFLCSRNWIKT